MILTLRYIIGLVEVDRMKFSMRALALLILRFGLAAVSLFKSSQKTLAWLGGSGIASFAGDLTRLGILVVWLPAPGRYSLSAPAFGEREAQ
jgi:hypothetical protein